MRRENQNYIFISMGFAIIILFSSFHLIQALSDVMQNYNWLARTVNDEFNTNYKESYVAFFGKDINVFNLLLDVFIVIAIILVILMVFLKIYWSEKDREKKSL